MDCRTYPPPSLPAPTQGGIYRDQAGESFVVLAMHGETIFIEYASGRFQRIPLGQWPALQATPAKC